MDQMFMTHSENTTTSVEPNPYVFTIRYDYQPGTTCADSLCCDSKQLEFPFVKELNTNERI